MEGKKCFAVVGGDARRLAEAQFTTALATFTASGMDTDTAMERASDMVRHRALRAQLESCRRQMLEGRSLAQAVYDNRVFEPLYARMLMSGTAGSLTIVSGCDATNPDTPRVLGVHMVSQMASDIIAEAEQLVGNHVPLADAARLVHPHPTFSETLGEALLKADGRPLHTR